MRHPIRIDSIWRPLLLVGGGATRDNSYVDVSERGVIFRMGPFFNRTLSYGDIKSVFSRGWPWLYGIGWRTNFRGVIGLVGSYQNVVEVRLNRRIRRFLLLFPCDRICVSLDDPAAFIRDLNDRLAPPIVAHGAGSAAAKPASTETASHVSRAPGRKSGPDEAPTAAAVPARAERRRKQPPSPNGAPSGSVKPSARKATKQPSAPEAAAPSRKPRRPKGRLLRPPQS